MSNDTLTRPGSADNGFERFKATLIKLHILAPREEPEPVRQPVRKPQHSSGGSKKAPSVYEQAYRREHQPKQQPKQPSRPAAQKNKNTQLRTGDMAVYYVDSLQSCTLAIRAVIEGTNVVVHFVNTDRALSQRIIDTLSGAAFALSAKIRKIADNTYVIAPEGSNVFEVHPKERRY